MLAVIRISLLGRLSSQSSWEEFHYQYDTSGRITNATFAMTPESGYTPSTGATYYPYSGHSAGHRARAYYEYDAAGRLTMLANWWDNYSSGYSSVPMLKNECDYELTGTYKRGLKTHSRFYSNSGGSWVEDRDETYSYDNQRDFLVGANYDDGLSNATPTWSYDNAANRLTNSCSYDALNQQEQCNTFYYTYDALGNRTTRKNKSTSAIHTYTWDEINRLTGWTDSNNWTYAYRADGMRTKKARNNSATIFRYDGQMGIQDVEFSTNSLTWLSTTDYAVGARGFDAASVTNSSGTAVSYPIYDGHGNNIAMLSKSGTSYSLGNQRALMLGEEFGKETVQEHQMEGTLRVSATRLTMSLA